MAGRHAQLKLDDATLRRRRRAKNLAVGAALLALGILFYLITIVKIGTTLP
jgi:hypothetical protein